MREKMNVCRLLIVSMFAAAVCGAAFAFDHFCRGYDDGFQEGYCYQKPGCISPITPICPIPKFDESTYRDGYKRGFLDGLKRN
jgi:hypothetical protein